MRLPGERCLWWGSCRNKCHRTYSKARDQHHWLESSWKDGYLRLHWKEQGMHEGWDLCCIVFLDFWRGDTTKLQIFDAVYPTKCSTVSFILSSFLKFNTIITTTNHDERDHVITKLIFWKLNILPKRGIIITGNKLNKSKLKKNRWKGNVHNLIMFLLTNESLGNIISI